MRTRLVAFMVILFIVGGLAVFLIGTDLLINEKGDQTQLVSQELSSSGFNPIVRENAHRGTATSRRVADSVVQQVTQL